jgi:predicted AlkP superfamily phosphohydrolase/phosphomutase
MQTDTMQHELWHLLDPSHSAHDAAEWERHRERIEAIYVRIDQEFLKPIVEGRDADTTVLVMSDHGFGGIEHIVYMNLWLLQKGYIVWSRDWWTQAKAWMHRRGVTPRNMFRALRAVGLGNAGWKMGWAAREKWMNRGFMNVRRADWTKTTAYSMGNILGMVYLNVKGREPQGCVEPGAEYAALREKLMAELAAEVSPHTGERLFAKVEKGEDVFAGVYRPHGPDIVCTPQDWRYQVFGYQDFVSNRFVETYSEMTGHHRMDGILYGLGPAFKPGTWSETCKLVDLAPTILHLLGLPIPSDMDGRVLEELFSDDAWEYPQTLPVAEAEAVAEVELSAAEQQLVMQRLKDLGYEDGL